MFWRGGRGGKSFCAAKAERASDRYAGEDKKSAVEGAKTQKERNRRASPVKTRGRGLPENGDIPGLKRARQGAAYGTRKRVLTGHRAAYSFLFAAMPIKRPFDAAKRVPARSRAERLPPAQRRTVYDAPGATGIK